MPRIAISEFAAKRILYEESPADYKGVRFSIQDGQDEKTATKSLPTSGQWVVKVDQGVKKRGKLGLIEVNIPADQVSAATHRLHAKGFNQFLIEPFVAHQQSDEQYLSLQRVRQGIEILYSKKGGVDIEDAAPSDIKKFTFVENSDESNQKKLISTTPYPQLIQKLITICQKNHISFLELNPFIIQNDTPVFIDAAAQVDSAANFFTDEAWTEGDLIQKPATSPEEMKVQAISSTSPASFSLQILNPQGSIFLLLSGGGASIVIADELHNQGQGTEIANYGEYSGAPTEDETYEYTKAIISFMLRSKGSAQPKRLIIGGGVANFTDVSITFAGIVRALTESITAIKKQNIAIYVRRGGPNQEKGLKLMRDFMKNHAISGFVYGPDVSLSTFVKEVLQ